MAHSVFYLLNWMSRAWLDLVGSVTSCWYHTWLPMPVKIRQVLRSDQAQEVGTEQALAQSLVSVSQAVWRSRSTRSPLN